MTRAYREITYVAPLSEPLELDAYHAPAAGEWRIFAFPGTPCNRYLYHRFLRTAPPDLDVVVVTRPGFGRGHRSAVTDFDEQMAAIKPFLPGGPFGDKKIVTMGISYGGELALKAALDFPEAVKGAVTVAALIDEPHDYAINLEKLGGEPVVAPFVPDRWRRVRAEVAGRRAQIGPLMERLYSGAPPVEVLHGDFDAIVPKSNAEKLMEALGPAGRLELIPGGTHYLELQYPRRLHAAIQRVIARAESGAASSPIHGGGSCEADGGGV